MRRITLYLDDDAYKELRSILALKSMTVSEWARRQISQFILEDTNSEEKIWNRAIQLNEIKKDIEDTTAKV